MGLLSRFLAFFRRGLFGSKALTEDFIARIERGDVDYILRVGVPTVEAPKTPGPKPGALPIVASGVDTGSLILADPEALIYILVATEQPLEPLHARGGGLDVLRAASEYSKKMSGEILYMYGFPTSKTEVRLLAYNGFVTGIYLAEGQRTFYGRSALEPLETHRWEDVVLHVSKVKPALMEWSDDQLSVYIPGLDNQHKYLINTLNSLYHATVTGEAEEVISTILKRLIDYTRFHFRSEEILMEKYDYPQDRFTRHVREHNGFVQAVRDFREKYEAGEADLTLKVFKFLATWVQNHVAKTDRDYGVYFKKIGII